MITLLLTQISKHQAKAPKKNLDKYFKLEADLRELDPTYFII